jgi:hypothetical protein
VLRDGLEALPGDAPAARYVLEKRHDVVHPLGPPERDDEESIEGSVRAGARRAVDRGLEGRSCSVAPTRWRHPSITCSR